MHCFIGIAILTLNLIPNCFMDTPIDINAGLEPYDLLFDNAVEAYYKGDWISVILNMERALRNKGTVRRVRAHCRLSCANQTDFGEPISGVGVPIPGSGSVEDLGFFQNVLKRADCVNSCEREKLGPPSFHKVSEEVELEFRKRSPYNYLQVAYFKINKLNKAVAAAHTFYLANPQHLEMRQNLEYYRMMAGVQETDFKDLEGRLHMEEFLEGKKLYSADSFAPATDHFEAAVSEYLTADLECRALCEGPYDYDGYNYLEYTADLFQSMTDHYMQVLNCKQNCAMELATLPSADKPMEDFLPDHFNYLQFSYYNSENYEKAIECAKTYLLFHPEDEMMTQNLAFYAVTLGEDKAAGISAREVIQQHIKQSLLEKELLYFAFEAFGIAFVDPDKWTPADIMPQRLREKQKAERETAARITEEIGNLMKEIETLVEEKNKDTTDITKTVREGGNVQLDDIAVTMTAKALNGSQRVVLDKVISEDECRELHRLSNAAAQLGDGYRGKRSPHSPSEMFQGVTVLKALKLGQEGKVPLKSARLFFELSEKVRKVMESYFRPETTLYFSYTHLVCRSAIEEKQEGREDLSHPVHVDNCFLVSELNECIKEPPAYTHRDYSAILYLNDDFEGGDFIFAELDAKTVTAEVRPQCGRVVGFGSGKENPHGVRAVTKGQRCAVALWFTLDPRHNEKERIQAEDLLKMLSSPLDADFQKSSKDPESTQIAQTSETGEQANLQGDKQADAQTDKQAHQPTDTNSDQPTDKEAGQSTDTNSDQPTDKKASQSTDTNSDQPTDKKASQSTDTNSDQPTDKKASQSTDTNSDQPTDKKASQSTDTNSDQPTDKEAGQSTDINSDQPTDKKASQSTDTNSDQPTDKKASQSTDTNSDQPTDKKASQSTDTNSDQPTDKEAGQSTDINSDQPTDKKASQSTDTNSDQPTDKKDSQSTDTNSDQPTDKEAGQSTDTNSDQPTDKEAGQSTDTNSDQPTDKKASQSTDTNSDQPTDKKAGQSTDINSDQPTDKKASQSTDTNSDQPTDKKASQSTDKEAGQSTDISSDQPTDKKASQSTDTNSDQPTDKEAIQSTNKKADQPTDKKEVKQPGKKSEKQKQKATEKTASKQKAKQADKKKVKQADKPKVKEAATKKTDKQKDKPPVKKAAVKKSTIDPGTGTTATDSKAGAADSEKDRDEL